MQNNYFIFPPLSNQGQLETINGIKLTDREIDIIACILSGRGRKATASLLSISDKTVETHIRNIMRKLECYSQEGVRDKVEKSNKLTLIKQHYLNLLSEDTFKQQLQKVLFLTNKSESVYLFIYWQNQDLDDPFAPHLKEHLNLVGIKPLFKAREKYKLSIPLIQHAEIQQADYIIYLFPSTLPNQLGLDKNLINRDISSLTQKEENQPGSVIFVLQGTELFLDVYKDDSIAALIKKNDKENYYFLFFKILQKLLPDINLEKIISEFKEQYEAINGVSDKLFPQVNSEGSIAVEEKGASSYTPSLKVKKVDSHSEVTPIENSFKKPFWSKLPFVSLPLIKHYRKSLLIGTFCLVVFSIFFFTYKINNTGQSREIYDPSSVRSELALPAESVFLNRSDLITEIGNKLKKDAGIQTVALVGVGGSGKTALAHQYARQQKIPLIWEINAESLQALQESFENLAQALAKTEEAEKKLKEIQEIKNPTKKEEKILQLTKEYLKLLDSWLLIYDNTNNFSDIQQHFPKDPHTWGQGNVILTTQDSNIQNNKYVNDVIQIGALDETQKLNLFVKIMSNGKAESFPPLQEAEAKKFLKEIPSFPLDVSLAAYYLKATNIPYDTYLQDLAQYDKDFVKVQENLLKESGEYTKTRYSIIIMSLQQLIKAHQDFEALLLLISLLDSQDIPRDLLSNSKNNSIVDNFIYNLEKYSFITGQPSSPSSLNSTLSLHRSVPRVILEYLTKSLITEKKEKLLQETANILENYISTTIEKEDIPKMRLLARHGEVFLTHDNLLTEAMKEALANALGRVHFYLGDYMKAGQLLNTGLPFLRKHASETPLKIAKTLDTLGVIYQELGDYQAAKKVLDESLTIYEASHPQDYKEIAHTLTHLGSIYKELGDGNKARGLFERSLPLYEKCLPKDKKENIWTLVHLGIVHKGLGNYEKAINFLEQSLAIYKTHFPENYVRIAFVLAKLGNIHNLAGDYTKAKNILEQSIAIYKKHFSENNIGFACATAYLGNAHRALGNYAEAKELFKKSLAVYESYYGKDHIEVARILRSLGNIYLLEGQLETAESFLKRASEIFLKLDHPENKLVLEELAELQRKKLKKKEK